LVVIVRSPCSFSPVMTTTAPSMPWPVPASRMTPLMTESLGPASAVETIATCAAKAPKIVYQALLRI